MPPKPDHRKRWWLHEQRAAVRASILILVLALLLSPVWAEPSDSGEEINPVVQLDLESAFRIALANNPRLEALRARVEAAVSESEVQAAPARTQVMVRLAQDRVKVPDGAPISATFNGIRGTFRTGSVDPFDRTSASLRIQQLLYDGGRIKSKIAVAKSQARETELEELSVWNTLRKEIRLGYLDLLQSERRIELEQTEVKAAEEGLRVAQARFQAGDAPKADVIYAQRPLSDANLQLTLALDLREQAKEKLNLLLGLEQETGLRLSALGEPSPSLYSLPDCLSTAARERKDLTLAEARIETADKRYDAARKESRPRLLLRGDYLPVGFASNPFSNSGYEVGLSLEWPLIDGRLSHHLKERAAHLREAAEAEFRYRQQTVEQEVRTAHRALLREARTYQALAAHIEQAEESVRVAQGQYKAGFADIRLLHSAVADLRAARRKRLQALYDYHRAQANLLWAMGVERAGDVKPEL